MESVNPKLIVLLISAFCLWVFVQYTNPYQEYGTDDFWLSATIDDVGQIPDEVLAPNNQNGPAIMWAAANVKDPNIIKALVERGADVNERDSLFKGTALSAAAYQNPHPEIIDQLVALGAKVNVVLGKLKKSPLLLAAEQNNPDITERLLFHGADPNYKDAFGKTAYQQAIAFENQAVVNFYQQWLENNRLKK
ncbi:ankyrin repeat domain-containing protein [Thalassotalea ganghwensis]